MWLLITLSKEYVTTITLPVSFKKIPQNKLLQTTPLKEIKIKIKATGFKIVRANFNNKFIELDASVLFTKSASKYYFLSNNQKNKIQQQLLSKIEIQEVFPDTIHLKLGSLISRKIPVKPNLDIKYHIGYDVLEEIKIVPDSIIVSGPDSQISKIKTIDLNLLRLEDVKSDFDKKVSLKKSNISKNLKFSTNFVSISGKVEKFTEGSFHIPFKIINVFNYRYRIFFRNICRSPTSGHKPNSNLIPGTSCSPGVFNQSPKMLKVN